MVEYPVHFILTKDEPFGWFGESPQLPGFVFHRQTETEILRDYMEALRQAGVNGSLVGHRQYRRVTPEGVEYLLRVRDGEAKADRAELASRVEQMLLTDDRHDYLNDAPRTPMGEVVIICALPGDTLGGVVEQLDERGDGAAIAMPVADSGVWSTMIAAGPGDRREGWRTLAELGYSMDMTIGELSTKSPVSDHPTKMLVTH